MNVLSNQLSTLCTLWSSLDIDALTMNKKLKRIIQELDTLIIHEKREKTLLQANIEDMMSNIEYASTILGVSLENMLHSSTNQRFTITPETVSIYNNLNPTYPKQKALMELNSNLTKEISTRQNHMNEWLAGIQQLCHELQLPYKFKSNEEYQDSDLSWATIQSISCELRDLKDLQKCRIQQFTYSIKSIHYYWQLLRYKPNINDTTETSLASLFENFPSTIQNEITHDYYHHPANQFQLDQKTLTLLDVKQNSIKQLYDARLQIYRQSVKKIKATWEEFNIPILERPVLPTTFGEQDMLHLKEIVDNIEPLLKRLFDKYIQQFKDQLIPLWDACLLSEFERTEFIASLYEKNTKLEIKSEVDGHIMYLESIQLEGQALKALMKERKDLIQEMIDFEKKASDPKRLFQASFQLIEEEKWRNTCLPRLLQLDRQLIKAIGEYENLAGKPVMIGDRRYLDTLLDEIADREANQTFFGFLNTGMTTAPAKQRIHCNSKSRPSSVGSLGSILQQQQQKKHPHQLKTRAVSANGLSSLTNKKMKPSQSMPLCKKTTTTTSTTKKSPLKKEEEEEDVYSSTAYINSNITLNKAFRQRGQTASLIPIASRALTTTKSV